MAETSEKSKGLVELTETENELYDRQIRLWGLESQKRLRNAKVLISGLTGIGAEVTKNIILSGVNSVVLHDDKVVTEEDFTSQFLVDRMNVGKNRAESSVIRAQSLNPMVELITDTKPLSEKDGEYFKKFDVVVVCGASNKELLRIDEICRKEKLKLFAGDVWGMHGFCFADLNHHSFIEDAVKHKVVSLPNGKFRTDVVTTTVHRELNFPPYSKVVDFDIKSEPFQKKLKRTGPALIIVRILQEFRENFGRDPSYKTRESDLTKIEKIRDEITDETTVPIERFLDVFSQISPAAAVVGGVLAQEVIKVITKREAPHRNVFLFDPDTCCGFIETIGVEEQK